MKVADLVVDMLGGTTPVTIEAYDGSRAGPDEAPATIVIRSPDALRRLLTAPGELGLGRAYVVGDLDAQGDIDALLALGDELPTLRPSARTLGRLARLVGPRALRPPAPPEEEARLRGRRHTRARDAAAVSHHYDVSNDFYRIVLGPSMTYSCGVWESPDAGLNAAQDAKHELVCRKLGLREGMRVLDVGCGWGSFLIHAATHHGITGVGVTLSQRQVELAAKRIAETGLTDRLEVRLQDYRDIDDEPFDAVASIGMFEHVGRPMLEVYFTRLWDLVTPGGRLLNHGISRPPGGRARFARRGFIDRYVFPDGELHEVGNVVTLIQEAGFEVRHVESLREHYALTLRAWRSNLEAAWDDALALVGTPRARIWRLYMAGSARNFEAGSAQIHQVLAVRAEGGRSKMPWRPDWERGSGLRAR